MIINSFVFVTTGFDPDAQAFITAANITNLTEQNAINQLVIDFKNYGLWVKMSVIYPMVGGTATTHKFNLKNPLDTNAAFRVFFSGGWLHTSTGAKPNAINAYGDTFFNPQLHSLQNSHHFSLYLRTDGSNNVPFGCTSSTSGLYGSNLSLRFSNLTYNGVNQTGYSGPFGDTDSKSFYVSTRTASNVIKLFKRNVLQINSTVASVLPPSRSYYIAHWNSVGSVTYFSPNEISFTTIGEGLTDSEVANLYTSVQTFQTTLGRQI